MRNALRMRVLGTSLDRADGALGAKRMTAVVAILLVLGAVVIFGGQRYIESIDTWHATVTGVAKHTVNFTFDADAGETEVAEYPSGMAIHQGDRVLVKVDEEKGNFVTEVLDE